MATDGGEIDDSPVEQVRLTVPITDDKSLPALSFRAWVLGLVTCTSLAFINQFFAFRQNPLYVSSTIAQIVVLPIGKLMARTLPTKIIRVPGTKWTFSLNPGPFSIKEHALTSIFATGGDGVPFSMAIITLLKVFYHRKIHPMAALLLIVTTQMLGYGYAGMFMKLLVESPYMWWPGSVVSVSFFRALHEVELRRKGQLTRFQFFLLASISSFAYYIVPNFFFPSITALSFVCWIWKDSVRAQQIGSGFNGLGLGSISLDWSAVSGYAGNPLASPMFAIVNVMAGFILIMYVIGPIAYWTNLYDAKRFPFASSDLFDANGHLYNISRVLDERNFSLDQEAYDNYSRIYLSTFYVFKFGFCFSIVPAALSHTALFYGRSIWIQLREAYRSDKENGDIHVRMVKKNYDSVPQWWFYAILISMFGISVITCQVFKQQLQLPFWGIILGCAMVLVFIVPVSIIAATTGQSVELNILSELIIGYLLPGKPVANMAFKAYATLSLDQATFFLSDLKQGLYMKIPPRSMFMAQIGGTLVGSCVYFSTAWWLLSSIENICDSSKLPRGSPWTCPNYSVGYSTSSIWGIAGPSRMFAPHGLYANMYWFFLLGALLPVVVWALSRKFPEKKWIRLIHTPIILGGAPTLLLPAGAMHFWSWFAIGVFFNYFIYRKFKGWWAKYTYVLSGGLDVGVAFMSLLVTFVLKGIYGVNWWGVEFTDHCPLAQCPTAPHVEVDGCPVFG